MRTLLLLPLWFSLAACDSDSTPTAAEPPLKAGCNPLAGSPDEDCFLPFPSSAYLKQDPGTATGLRVNIPDGVLPVSRGGKPILAAPLNRADGFSPATRLLAYFPSAAGIDKGSLPGAGDLAASLKPESTVQLLRYDTGERVPVFAEIDENASVADKDRQAILVHPALRLQPKTRYVAAIQGVKDGGHQPLPPLSGFRALRDGQASASGPRAGEIARTKEILAALDKAGVKPEGLQLAWDFTTASDESTSGRMVRMRDQARDYAPTGGQDPPPPLTVAEVHDRPYDNLQRQVLGTFTVPSYLTDDAGGRLNLDAHGEPQMRGYGQFPLVVHVPACVNAMPSPVPVPIMVYGHGLFGDARGEMESGYQREIINRLCMIQVGTDWIGLAEADGQYVEKTVLSDFNNFIQVTDRLQQAHVNVATLFRLLKGGLLDRVAELQLGGQPLADRRRVYYYGISDGGIQGATALALTPDTDRGCLNVPGGFWSLMMWRSADFAPLGKVLAASYPDAVDRQLLAVLSQPQWDFTDPATYAPHLLKDPLPGSVVKKVLYQEGLGDAQVPNFATRAMVRTMGLKMLTPGVEPVFGVETAAPPLESAYVQFDIGEAQAPRAGDVNVPPRDNDVHEAIRRLEAARDQLQRFLREDGKVEDTCAGKPCVFPK